MRDSGAFLGRAVRYLAAEAGIRQFLDIGSGLPTTGSVHEVVTELASDARVVYVDNDPVAVQHGRAVLASTTTAVSAQADLRRPREILASPELRQLLDLTSPIGLLLATVLHFIPDDQDPGAAVAWLQCQLPAGSYLVISHATADSLGAQVATAGEINAQAMPSFQLRSHTETLGFFGDLELIEPGLVLISDWKPRIRKDASATAEPAAGYAGVAIKP